MEPYYADADIQLHLGSVLDVLPTLADASVDAVVCDPPYGLTDLPADTVTQALTAWLSGDRAHVPTGKGFMGKEWDRFVPPPAVWDECLRVLKPGGHLLAFAGSRTIDLMTLSIRLAGFEIRDSIDWIYGSGMPKSLDVAKAIDQAGGASPAEQARVLRTARERAGLTREDVAAAVGCTVSSVRDWEDGRARAVGRPVEFIVPSAPYREALADLLGYSADERRIVGITSDRRGDGTVIGLGHSGVKYGAPATASARDWQGWGTGLKPAHEPIVVARKPLAGTVAATVLEHGTGAINVGACRVGDEARVNNAGGSSSLQRVSRVAAGYRPTVTASVGESSEVLGRWPTNIILGHGENCVDGGACGPGCPVAEMDAQSGVRTSGSNCVRRKAGSFMEHGGLGKAGDVQTTYGDSGGASRYFSTFRYEAKAPGSERPRLADGTTHTTVKPLSLCRWLVRLVTPPNGVVLDPFAGSGTTLEAAVTEGFRAIGVELLPEHADLCVQRLSKPITPVLFGESA